MHQNVHSSNIPDSEDLETIQTSRSRRMAKWRHPGMKTTSHSLLQQGRSAEDERWGESKSQSNTYSTALFAQSSKPVITRQKTVPEHTANWWHHLKSSRTMTASEFLARADVERILPTGKLSPSVQETSRIPSFLFVLPFHFLHPCTHRFFCTGLFCTGLPWAGGGKGENGGVHAGRGHSSLVLGSDGGPWCLLWCYNIYYTSFLWMCVCV